MHIWELLPSKIDSSQVRIPEGENGIINIIKDKGYESILFANCNCAVNTYNLYKILNNLYIKEFENKRITTRQNSKYYFMEFDTNLRDSNNVPIHICLKKNKAEQNGKWIVNLVGFSSAEREFEKYVYIEDWSKLLNELSNIVLKGENWDLADKKGEKHILKQYLLFTYYKARLDNLILESEVNKEYAIFDTGLVDDSYDKVYCLLKTNSNNYDFYNRKWSFDCFGVCGISDNGKKINKNFGKKPCSPKYIDKLEDVFYDTSKDLSCDFEHIIKDNLKRLPAEFLYMQLSVNDKYKTIAKDYLNSPNDRTIFEKVKKIINEDAGIYRNINHFIKDKVEIAKKYCEWNYKTAIPIYYPRTNSISLLLPICLNETNVPDVALVVQKLPSGTYQGQTILTLDMAYQDARLISRPSSEWLRVDNIKSTNINEEDDDD